MRQFPAPWTIEDNGSSWCVSDASGMRMVWFCYGGGVVIGTNSDRLTRDEARRLAAGFAKLPTLIEVARGAAECPQPRNKADI